MIALIHEWVSSTGAPLSEIADKALTLAGGGLALSAVVELAYTFFTRGPDEALDPLILGISSFALINISRHDPSLTTAHAIPVALLAVALTLLFLVRRFLLHNEARKPPSRNRKVRTTQAARPQRPDKAARRLRWPVTVPHQRGSTLNHRATQGSTDRP